MSPKRPRPDTSGPMQSFDADRITKLIGPIVLIERLATPDRTESGIFIPTTCVSRDPDTGEETILPCKELSQWGWVRAVGQYWSGRSLELSVGDLVMFPIYHDHKWQGMSGSEYLRLRIQDILAVLTHHTLVDPRRV